LHLLRETSARKEQALAFPVTLLLGVRDRCTRSFDGYALDAEWTANAVAGSRPDTGAHQVGSIPAGYSVFVKGNSLST